MHGWKGEESSTIFSFFHRKFLSCYFLNDFYDLFANTALLRATSRNRFQTDLPPAPSNPYPIRPALYSLVPTELSRVVVTYVQAPLDLLSSRNGNIKVLQRHSGKQCQGIIQVQREWILTPPGSRGQAAAHPGSPHGGQAAVRNEKLRAQ